MKTGLVDYIRCSIAIAFVGALSIGLTAVAIHPVTNKLLGEYRVIADFLGVMLLYGVLSALLLRAMLLVRMLPPGDYSMESQEFAYWKLLSIVYRLGQKALLPFTPEFMRPVVAKLYGASVGSNVAIGGTIDDPYLVSIGDGVVIGHHALVSGSVIANGRISIGKVTIGAGTTIGVNAIVLPRVVIGNGALVVSASVVISGTEIPAGETWRGNPARKWQ